jgi:hypothetical protein
MTSINAIRFDDHSGAMICDEQRHWNPERIKVYAADKIRSIVPEELREKYGLAACYGNTGTSAIGDELRLTMHREVEAEYRRRCREEGRVPDEFLSIREVVKLGWRVICRMKHAHVDEHLHNKFGFSTSDVIRGCYHKDGKKIPIENPEVVKEAMEAIARDPNLPASDAVFGNGGIIAGLDQKTGFKIYLFSMKDGMVEPSESGYAALGSGGDTTNFVLPRFFNREGASGREKGIDRVEGICALLDAVNMASEHNLGVGGYFNIILFDQLSAGFNGLYTEYNDHRSKLSMETVKAHRAGFITHSACLEITCGLLFEGQDVNWAEEKLWQAAGDDRLGLHRLLRGYPVIK